MSSSGVNVGIDSSLSSRTRSKTSGVNVEEIDQSDVKRTQYDETADFISSLAKLESFLGPIFFTLLSFAIRFYRISVSNYVVWDEAHFGKFGSYYLRHEFYHDVHPPLGKMLIGLSGYLAGYNGSWDFPSGEKYPDFIDYTKMRMFNATFSSLCVPIAYFTCKQVGFSLVSTWLFTTMVCLELSYITLGKFILLDSMLLFFTTATFLNFATFHNLNKDPKKVFTRKWWKWLILTGVAIGCACSVKMVGLFVTTLVGIYTIIDLWSKFGDKALSWKTYIFHWIARIFGLIIVPLLVVLACFKVHFDLLYKSGTGDANMSSLFQANLLGSDLSGGARDITIGHSVITLKNQGLTGGLLHSHGHSYPDGSKQQQVTTYSHKDANNHWVIQRPRPQTSYNASGSEELEYVYDGMSIRLIHPNTGRNLHTHNIQAPVSKSYHEVACYGNLTIGDQKDNWIVEIMENPGNEDKTKLHSLTSSFRLKNQIMDCYLAVSGTSLPAWGYRQGEVVCIKDPFKKDKRTWWNIENNENKLLPKPENFTLPRTRFLRDFIELNLAMMATNNALVPDGEKQDDLASQAWQWPTLHAGIRLCSWADDKVKYFLLGSPVNTWFSSVAVVAFAGLFVALIIRWQRQTGDFANDPSGLSLFVYGGVYPMLGWGLHFVPFFIMGRVLYTHHYLPALYFAMMVLCFEVEFLTTPLKRSKSTIGKLAYAGIYALAFGLVIASFWYWRHISFGMEGPKTNFSYLDWMNSWRIANDNNE